MDYSHTITVGSHVFVGDIPAAGIVTNIIRCKRNTPDMLVVDLLNGKWASVPYENVTIMPRA